MTKGGVAGNMFEVSFIAIESAFTAIWLLIRISIWIRQKSIDWKREAIRALMYINLSVFIRFALFPRDLVDGRIQPLVFDTTTVFPLRINPVPFVHLFDYDNVRDIVWNTFGNVAMFIPTGIMLPIIYRRLNSVWKAAAAGALISLCIEILQLPFPSRASDIDDLIVNTIGVVVGYGIYSAVKRWQGRKKIDTYSFKEAP